MFEKINSKIIFYAFLLGKSFAMHIYSKMISNAFLL